jgi:hypothetical protein
MLRVDQGKRRKDRSAILSRCCLSFCAVGGVARAPISLRAGPSLPVKASSRRRCPSRRLAARLATTKSPQGPACTGCPIPRDYLPAGFRTSPWCVWKGPFARIQSPSQDRSFLPFRRNAELR